VPHVYDAATETVSSIAISQTALPDVHGRKLSFVTHVFDLDTQTLVPTGVTFWAASVQGSRGRRALAIQETGLTGDLNGDGDSAGDRVLHLFDSATLALTNLQLATERMRMGRRHVAFTVIESRQGVDLNGDGDQLDRVLHLHWLASGETVNLGLAGDLPSSTSTETDYGSEVGPWVPFLRADGRPLLVRVY
jgi:hypothetical protein